MPLLENNQRQDGVIWPNVKQILLLSQCRLYSNMSRGVLFLLIPFANNCLKFIKE